MTITLEQEMEGLHRDLLEMCGLVEELTHQAVHLIAHGSQPDQPSVEAVVAQDDEIDRWDVRIEDACLRILAEHHPVASDLRRIAAVMKITGELERVADLSTNIAKRARGLGKGPEMVVPDHLEPMGDVALDMLRKAMNAFVQYDSALAHEVRQQDDEVDDLNREILDALKLAMQQNPDVIEPALHLFSATRHLERVADHATNIAEDVIYLVEGEIVRHQQPIDTDN